MNRENDPVMAYDMLYTNNHIQVMKTALPYLPESMRPVFIVWIKYMEFQYTMELMRENLLYCKIDKGSKKITDFFNNIKQYLPKEEQRQVEQIEKLYHNMEQMKQTKEMMDMFNLFSGEQDIFSTLGKSEGSNLKRYDEMVEKIFNGLNK